MLNEFSGAYPDNVLISKDITVLIFCDGQHIANGILVSPSDVLTTVGRSIRESDQRAFIIKYGDKTNGGRLLKEVRAIPGLIPNLNHNLNSIRKNFGFLRVSSCIQNIRV